MARVGTRELVMLLYAGVWGIILTVLSIQSGQWPPPEAWATLGIGEGALMAAFRVDEAWRRRAGNEVDE
jgi:hypothetical protein